MLAGHHWEILPFVFLYGYEIIVAPLVATKPVYQNTLSSAVLLQHNADPLVNNTDGKTPLDLADASAKLVLSGTIEFIKKYFSKA